MEITRINPPTVNAPSDVLEWLDLLAASIASIKGTEYNVAPTYNLTTLNAKITELNNKLQMTDTLYKYKPAPVEILPSIPSKIHNVVMSGKTYNNSYKHDVKYITHASVGSAPTVVLSSTGNEVVTFSRNAALTGAEKYYPEIVLSPRLIRPGRTYTCLFVLNKSAGTTIDGHLGCAVVTKGAAYFNAAIENNPSSLPNCISTYVNPTSNATEYIRVQFSIPIGTVLSGTDKPKIGFSGFSFAAAGDNIKFSSINILEGDYTKEQVTKMINPNSGLHGVGDDSTEIYITSKDSTKSLVDTRLLSLPSAIHGIDENVCDTVTKTQGGLYVRSMMKKILMSSLTWSQVTLNANMLIMRAALTNVNSSFTAPICSDLIADSYANVSSTTYMEPGICIQSGYVYVKYLSNLDFSISGGVTAFATYATNNKLEMLYRKTTTDNVALTNKVNIELLTYDSPYTTLDVTNTVFPPLFTFNVSNNIGSTINYIIEIIGDIMDMSTETISDSLVFANGSTKHVRQSSIDKKTYSYEEKMNSNADFIGTFRNETDVTNVSTIKYNSSEVNIQTTGKAVIGVSGNNKFNITVDPDTQSLYPSSNQVTCGKRGEGWKEVYINKFILLGFFITRPTIPAGYYAMGFDASIARQIWWNGTKWTDSNGTAV